MKKPLVLMVLALVTSMSPARAAGLSGPIGLSERVAADTVATVPMIVKDGYIFIPGEVNGKAGKFMLDNGSPFRFFLNSHYVNVTVGPEIARGRAGSGQPIVVHTSKDVDTITFGDNAYRAVSDAMAADFQFIENGIVPDYLGFIGAKLLSAFTFSINYSQTQLAFSDASRPPDVLYGKSKPVALVAFEGNDGSLPYATFGLGGVELRARFDTGSAGVLQLPLDLKTKLEKAGNLYCRMTKQDPPTTVCKVTGLKYGDTTFELDGLQYSEGHESKGTFGAALLRHYLTIWNLQKRTIEFRH